MTIASAKIPVMDSPEPRPLVLIADDEPRIRRALRRFLSQNGYDILEAEDGDRAVELAKEHRPDIAVLDLCMPGTNGVAVTEALKTERPKDLHVIVLSAADDSENRLQAFDAGANDFIAKPANLDELIRRIEAARRMQKAWRAERNARERAERLHVMHSEAVSLLAHDLNNGFAVILASLQFLEEELETDRDQEGALQDSLLALRRMIGLTSNFVDVNQIEEGVLNPRPSTINIAELVGAVAKIHQASVANAAARIEVLCEAGLLADVDPALTERVLHNLVGNALRYVNHGGDVGISAWSHGDRIRLSVTNTGSRIPERLRPHLFEKYRKGADGKAMRGMGLYFCRLACEALGGSIWHDSSCASTRFIVELPGRTLRPVPASSSA